MAGLQFSRCTSRSYLAALTQTPEAQVTDHHGHREAPRDARAQRGLGAGVVGVGHGASASHGHGVRRRVSRGGKDPWCPPSAAWQRDVC